MRVFLNPACGYGSGYRRFQRIGAVLEARFGSYDVETVCPKDIRSQVVRALDDGERMVVAAGGDGTVNLLAEALLEERHRTQNVVLGAIGIGSSNDFHKPYESYRMIRGIPVRMNRRHTEFRDVIEISYTNGDEWHTRFACINASLGICAEANALYNNHNRFIHVLKCISTDLAIIGAAVTSIFSYENNTCRFRIEEDEFRTISLTNLGILKSPHFAGFLRYNTPVETDDGLLRINLCEGMNRLEVLSLLFRLMNHEFRGRGKTHSWIATKAEVSVSNVVRVEIDGEVIQTSHIVFRVLPHALRCCT